MVYHGFCHCGALRFTLDVPSVTSALACDCSLCAKKGYLWIVPPAGAFTITRDDGLLDSYESASLRHKFCRKCSTGITGEHTAGPLKGQTVVNLLAVKELDPFTLEYARASFLGGEFLTYRPAVKTLHVDETKRTLAPTTDAKEVFACHCGAVQVEMLVPLAGQQIKQDNCSSCVRKAYIGVYPDKDDVRVHGEENAVEYRYQRKFGGDMHCGKCGVFVYAKVYGPPLSVFDKVPPERKEHVMAVYHKNMRLFPLNVRAMEGVDVSKLEIERDACGTEGYEPEN